MREDKISMNLNNPIFIVGCGRSGTSMLTSMMATHEDIAVFPHEANNFWHPKSYPWRQSKGNRIPIWLDPCRFTHTSLQDWTDQDKKRIKDTFTKFQRISNKGYFLNKSTMIIFMIDFVLELFPESRFIHLYRDGRAVAFSHGRRESVKMQLDPSLYKRRGVYYPCEILFEKCAIAWRDQILEMESQMKKKELRKCGIIHELSYETLCESPIHSLVGIASFLGVDTKRFQRDIIPVTKNMNYKYKQALDPLFIDHLTKLMQPALEIKGYVPAAVDAKQKLR